MEILDDVLEEVKPTEEERENLEKLVDHLLKKANDKISEFDLEVEPKLVGSAARGTWLSDQKDIDIFLLFQESIERDSLEKWGLKLGREIAGDKGSEQYAEHPYIYARIKGFDIDIVPCYDVDDPSKIKSSVDRSPYHQEYVGSWLTPEKADEVLLLKKFLKGIGVYGSDLRVKGFSGYLSELLIQYSGSFRNLLDKAKEWGERKVINLDEDRNEEKLKKAFPDQPLIFIDPVDASRNVAAALSKKNYSIFVRACEDFVKEPDRRYFFPKEPPTSRKHLKKAMESRGTNIFLISFQISEDLVPDIVYPQLRKTEGKIVDELERREVEIIRSSVWNEGDRAAILLESKFSKLPASREHIGPPVGINAGPFIKKYQNSEEKISGPFVRDDGRLVFELRRDERQVIEIIKNVVESRKGFGSYIKKSISNNGYNVFEGTDVIEKANELDALDFLGEYLSKSLPWYR